MTSAAGLADPMARLLIDELQARVDSLAGAEATDTIYDDTDLRQWVSRELSLLKRMLDELSDAQQTAAGRMDLLSRTLRALDAHVISNSLGETIPAHSVLRASAYAPDTEVYTAAKPQGLGVDRRELLMFTGFFDIESVSLGLAYRTGDRIVKAHYDAPDVAFEPTIGKGYVTQAASWRLLGLDAGDGFAFFIGVGSVAEEWDTSDGLTWIRERPMAIPPLLKTTTAAAGGEISARQVDESFAVTGITRTFLTEP